MPITEWPASRAAWERAKHSLSGGVATALRASAKPHPIYFSGGAGAVLTDIDGNEYYDYVLGWGPNILGHGNPALVSAVQEQIVRGATYGSGHHLEYQVAEQLLDAFPGMERVLWSNTGTEADLSALRIVRAATGRDAFVKFGGHYHGWSDPMLLGYRPGAGSLGQPESRGQLASSADYACTLPWGDLVALQRVFDERDDIAAVFLEPVLCNSGVIEPPAGFLEGVRELCDRHGAVLVFDEVITGLRIARGGAVERYGVVPDIVVLAKAVAGGLSLSAVLGKARFLDLTLEGVTHAGTYNGNPLVLAGAAATLAELGAPGVYEEFERLGRRLADGLRSALARHDRLGAVNQVGPIVQLALGLEAIDDYDTFMRADQATYSELLVELLRRGVFAVPGGRWYLSTAHDDAIVDDTLVRFDAALAALGTGGR
jgi:glutamate-1-semialdehyde 2,1-aminomutase